MNSGNYFQRKPYLANLPPALHISSTLMHETPIYFKLKKIKEIALAEVFHKSNCVPLVYVIKNIVCRNTWLGGTIIIFVFQQIS